MLEKKNNNPTYKFVETRTHIHRRRYPQTHTLTDLLRFSLMRLTKD